MIILDYFIDNVLPQLPDEQIVSFFERYPNIRLSPENGFVSVVNLPVLMLVALTGTGKTTTLNALTENYGALFQVDLLPARRDLANFIIIPTAQVLAGDAIQPVSNREDRFRYTGLFAQYFEGGMAAVYAALFCTPTTTPIISEGIRGAQEIRYALVHCTGWQIVELSLHPMTRLQRLSSRNDAFDQVNGSDDLSFLPASLHEQVQNLMSQHLISAKAIAIMRAESQNYGLMSYSEAHERYVNLAIDGLNPQQVSAEIAKIIETRMVTDAAY